MKKILAILLCAVMLLGTVYAEETQTGTAILCDDTEHLTVGTTTAMSGRFFTELFGGSAADYDVQNMIHGYSLINWDSEKEMYATDETVVSGMVARTDTNGNIYYTLSLYQDLVYSDGTPITAWDYAFTMLLSASSAIGEIGADNTMLDYVYGAAAYREGSTNTFEGVRVLNDYQLEIEIDAAYRPFFYELAVLNVRPYPISVIAPGCKLADNGKGVYIKEGELTAELLRNSILDPQNGYMNHPSLTCGAYLLTAYDADNGTAEFEINDNYKGDRKGYKPAIRYVKAVTVTNEDAVEKLQNGEIGLLNHMAGNETIQRGMALIANRVYTMTSYPRVGLTYVSLNCEKPGISDREVRVALAQCFDRTGFANSMAIGTEANGFYGIGQWMFQRVNGTIQPDVEVSEEEAAEWAKLSMADIPTFTYDPAAAAETLDKAGWKLNAEGIRAREINGQQVVLDLTLMTADDEKTVQALQTYFAQPLENAGIRLSIQTMAPADVLDLYYRKTERDCDMFYLASNFTTVFDPSALFNPAEEAQGVENRTGLRDGQLYALAVDMRKTEPGDTLSYCKKWIAFQQRFMEVMPLIPIYSNMYFDFYQTTLQNYDISQNTTWSQAVIESFLGDYSLVPEETKTAEEPAA